MNRDLMNNADAGAVAKASFALLDRLQHYPQHIQPMALAAAFVVLSEHIKVPAQDIFTITKNLLNAESGLAELAALKDYVKFELKGAA